MNEESNNPLPSYEIFCPKCQLEFIIHTKRERGGGIWCPTCRGPAYLTDPEEAQRWERFNEV